MIDEYLQELLTQKANLAENLKAKGVDADASETLNTLVPKVLNIQNGGGYKKLPLFLCGSDEYADSVFTIFQNGMLKTQEKTAVNGSIKETEKLRISSKHSKCRQNSAMKLSRNMWKALLSIPEPTSVFG